MELKIILSFNVSLFIYLCISYFNLCVVSSLAFYLEKIDPSSCYY